MEPATGASIDILQPSNLLVFMVFYSPIIVCISILVFTFMIQSFKGFIYLGFMFAASILREFLYYAAGGKEPKPESPICSAIDFSGHGNNTYSSFMLSFTLMYLCFPMFMNSSMNWLLFGGLVAYLAADVAVRMISKCSTSVSMIFANIVGGLILGLGVVASMSAGGSAKYLMFNDVQSNKVVCSRPKKQQFKCAVYKNGELIRNKVIN